MNCATTNASREPSGLLQACFSIKIARMIAQNTSDRPALPIRMIALDLDGTLLRSDKTVGARTIEALRAAHAKGVEIVLASGRMTPAMEETAKRLELDVCIVSYNGAAVCGRTSKGRPRLFHQPLNSSVAKELFAYARANRYQVNFYHEDVIISEDAPHLLPYIDVYRSRTGSPYQFVKNLEEYLHHAPTKFLLVVDPETRPKVEADLRPRFGKMATIIRTDPEYLEFLDPKVDKGAGVKKLAEILGFDMRSVMAMGDGENDVPMLQAAGWPVAVANANEHCRSVARAFTQNDHDHDAVAEAVERYVL